MNSMETRNARYDVVVCGGGIPGVCAAISAARSGAKAALIEQRPILGGNSSSFARVPPHGAAAFWHNRNAREGGIMEELLMEYAARSPLADNRRIWDLILREWCVGETNLNLYLNSRVDGVEMQGNRIKSVRVTQSSTETVYDLSAPVFIDATGDAFVAAAAGADLRIGREGRDELGEKLAPEKGDSKTLPSALYLIAHRRDRVVRYTPPDWAARHDDCSAFPHRPHVVDKFSKGKLIAEDGSAIQMFWWFSLGGEGDIIKDNEQIYSELVREVMGVWDHLKNRCTPETREALECYEAVWWSPFPLRRESRRVMGDYMLTEGDIFEPKLFEDRVSYGGWPVDVHPPEGIRSKDPPCDQTFVNELYSVPLRIMYSRNIDNLMLAGRCISASHVAMGSIRVMSSLGAAAQAAGMAAALGVRRGVDPREVGRKHIAELQQQLLRDDAYIIGLKNEDPADLARKAVVTTSSQLSYQVEEPDGYLELEYDLAQQLPISTGKIEKASVLLKSEKSDHCPVYISIYESAKLGRFDRKDPLAEAEFSIAPGEGRWFEVDVNREVREDELLWICLGKQPDVYWGYSNREAFGTRFAVKFSGELVPRPSHGKARIAPVKDDWLPINHNGRLPRQLHDWIEGTVGIEYDRKVRATLCSRVVPNTDPYEGRNVVNGISRAEDWPNIWISDPAQGFPQDITLRWDSPQTIREVLLIFDTDLDAPDRCFGWPREAHRFVFPVPECIKDYRILCREGVDWKELVHVEGNYNRRRVHGLATPVRTKELRVEVISTHGAPSARLYEIRVY